MPGNQKLFKRALVKWEGLAEGGHLSVPQEVGKTAIISSIFTDEPMDTARGVSELDSFRNEALALADRIHSSGGTPELAIDASRDEIDRLIKDPDVATMVVIGNGSLSNLMLGERDYYDWLNASDATDHLKQGLFVQRQCGGLTRTTNVPLGLFVVTDARHVLAALDDEFYPESLDDPVNDKIQSVFNTPSVTYEQIRELALAEGAEATQ